MFGSYITVTKNCHIVKCSLVLHLEYTLDFIVKTPNSSRSEILAVALGSDSKKSQICAVGGVGDRIS